MLTELIMPNHLAKILFIFASSLILLACHKPPVLDNKLALKLLIATQSLPGYSISIVTNNPNGRGQNPTGWNCADKQAWIDEGVVSCKKSGRSGVYLKFTPEGSKLLLAKPWGDKVLRNANVIAVSQRIRDVVSIEMIDNTHAIVNYTWIYDQHTPFSNAQLKKAIALNIPQTEQTSATLKNGEWTIEQ
ncbi:MAG: hypothetical protein COB22_04925 [Cycloclasticus sp.]|nr:MAG: hypothetical protein COB22_04925 [Cycloclasticus sp.]